MILFLIEGVQLVTIIQYSPYAFLAQSRAEILSGCGRTFVYLSAALTGFDLLDPVMAGTIVMATSFLMLLQNIFTQVLPMIEGLSFFLGARTIKLVKLIAKKACKKSIKKRAPRAVPAAEPAAEPAWASETTPGIKGGAELDLDDAKLKGISI